MINSLLKNKGLLIGTTGLVLGILLRFLWPTDMEYKADEAWMFNKVTSVGASESWPLVGMPSSGGINNPGMSVWIFLLPAKLLQITDPVSLMLVVAASSSLALLLLFLFILREIPQKSQFGWFCGLFLAAVNPFAVILQRKIWAQSMTPIFGMGILYCWWKREQQVYAFGWGLLGALIGQVHMIGFFVAACLVAVTAAASLTYKKSCAWMFWLIGSMLGALPLVPWFLSFSSNGTIREMPAHGFTLTWAKLWFKQPFTYKLSYSLGNEHFDKFLQYPMVVGQATYINAIVTYSLYGLGYVVVLSFLYSFWCLGRERWSYANQYFSSQEGIYFVATFLLLSLVLACFFRLWIVDHYMLLAFPAMYVFLGQMVYFFRWDRYKKLILFMILGGNLWITINFLSYIHINGGAPGGDYGVSYKNLRLNK